MKNRPLTALVHELLAAVLQPGDTAVDATAGNGLDTLFLARAVGATGHVVAIDRDAPALDATRARLQSAGLKSNTRLIVADHAELLAVVGHELQGRPRAVTFNLGYRPGTPGDIKTSPASTIPALRQATTLLAPNGRATILAYTGHDGGQRETRAVAEWCGKLKGPYSSREVRPPGTPEAAPRLFLIDRAVVSGDADR